MPTCEPVATTTNKDNKPAAYLAVRAAKEMLLPMLQKAVHVMEWARREQHAAADELTSLVEDFSGVLCEVDAAIYSLSEGAKVRAAVERLDQAKGSPQQPEPAKQRTADAIMEAVRILAALLDEHEEAEHATLLLLQSLYDVTDAPEGCLEELAGYAEARIERALVAVRELRGEVSP